MIAYTPSFDMLEKSIDESLKKCYEINNYYKVLIGFLRKLNLNYYKCNINKNEFTYKKNVTSSKNE